LPCLAKTGDDIIRSRSRPLAKLWLPVCVAVAILEGVLAYSFTWPYIYICPHSWPRASIKDLAPACFSRGPLHVFPELQDTSFERVLESSGVVVLGQFQGKADSGAYKLSMMGLLSQPIGFRTIVPIRNGADYEAYIRGGGRPPRLPSGTLHTHFLQSLPRQQHRLPTSGAFCLWSMETRSMWVDRIDLANASANNEPVMRSWAS